MFKGASTYFHPNMTNTGSVVKFMLTPASTGFDGYFFVKMAKQTAIKPIPAFDFDNAVSFKLTRDDLAQVLYVLRGMEESIMDGKGLFHRSAKSSTTIRFEHRIEPRPGYTLTVIRKPSDGAPIEISFTFTMSEAFTLMLSLEKALVYVCFGEPVSE